MKNRFQSIPVYTAASLFVICFVFAFPPLAISSDDHLAELKHELEHRTDPRQTIELLLILAEYEPDAMQAVNYAERAVFLSDSMRLPMLKAHALHKSGVAWKNSGFWLKSHERLDEALTMFGEMGLKKEEHIVMRNLGETYRAGESYDLAKSMLQDAYLFFEKTGDRVELAITADRIAATDFEVFYKKADKLLLEEFSEKEKDVFPKRMQEFPELEQLYNKVYYSLDLAEKLAFETARNDLLISNHIIRAAFYNRIHDYDKALDVLDLALVKMIETGITQQMPLLLTNQANIIGQPPISNPEEAIRLALEALEMAEEQNINIYKLLAIEVLHYNYLKLGNFKMAYHYKVIHEELHSQFQSDLLRMQAISRNYQLQLKERELQIRESRHQLVMITLVSVTLILAFLVFVTVLVRKNREKQRLLDEISKKNLLISEQYQELSVANADKDLMISVIAHDLRNPLNSILGFSAILKDKTRAAEDKSIQKYARIIHTSANNTSNLLENLLVWARLQHGKLTFRPKAILLNNVVNEICSHAEEMALLKNIQLSNDISETLIVQADRDMLMTVLRNLLSNALKYTQNGGSVTFSANKTKGAVRISITDTGIGLSKEQQESLLSNGPYPGTAGENNFDKGTGLGIILCKKFVEFHDGEIHVDSEPGKGSTFWFSLPDGDLRSSTPEGP